jgi:hypothetical protein
MVEDRRMVVYKSHKLQSHRFQIHKEVVNFMFTELYNLTRASGESYSIWRHPKSYCSPTLIVSEAGCKEQSIHCDFAPKYKPNDQDMLPEMIMRRMIEKKRLMSGLSSLSMLWGFDSWNLGILPCKPESFASILEGGNLISVKKIQETGLSERSLSYYESHRVTESKGLLYDDEKWTLKRMKSEPADRVLTEAEFIEGQQAGLWKLFNKEDTSNEPESDLVKLYDVLISKKYNLMPYCVEPKYLSLNKNEMAVFTQLFLHWGGKYEKKCARLFHYFDLKDFRREDNSTLPFVIDTDPWCLKIEKIRRELNVFGASSSFSN